LALKAEGLFFLLIYIAYPDTIHRTKYCGGHWKLS